MRRALALLCIVIAWLACAASSAEAQGQTLLACFCHKLGADPVTRLLQRSGMAHTTVVRVFHLSLSLLCSLLFRCVSRALADRIGAGWYPAPAFTANTAARPLAVNRAHASVLQDFCYKQRTGSAVDRWFLWGGVTTGNAPAVGAYATLDGYTWTPWTQGLSGTVTAGRMGATTWAFVDETKCATGVKTYHYLFGGWIGSSTTCSAAACFQIHRIDTNAATPAWEQLPATGTPPMRYHMAFAIVSQLAEFANCFL